jgi:hypothetical protein
VLEIMATIASACSACKKSFGEKITRCAQHVNASGGHCRAKAAVVRRVPIIVGVHDRNVGARLRVADVDPVDAEHDQDLQSGAQVDSNAAAADSAKDLARDDAGTGDGSSAAAAAAAGTPSSNSGTVNRWFMNGGSIMCFNWGP